VNVWSGSELDENTSNFAFDFSWDNFINFLNSVAKILWDSNEGKNFDTDREFFKNFIIKWDMDIKNKAISNSNILLELPLSSIDSQTWEKKYDLLTLQNQFKMPNPEKFNIDLTTLFFAKSTPNNKLQLRVTGSIK
jgi:hypothetical protein